MKRVPHQPFALMLLSVLLVTPPSGAQPAAPLLQPGSHQTLRLSVTATGRTTPRMSEDEALSPLLRQSVMEQEAARVLADPAPSVFDDVAVERVLAVARQQLERTTVALPVTQSPKSTRADGTWTTVLNTNLVGWTQGFFPGAMWMLHQMGGEPAWRSRADQWTRSLELQKTNTQTHDLGFKFMPSFGLAYQLTGDPYYRSVLLTAAQSLAARYNPTVGVIDCCDWNSAWDVPMVVDTMMNLELLFWASRNGGQSAWNGMALNHALKTMTDLVRPDGSTFHVVDYDGAGRIRSRGTFQGYSDSSTWARGQAWAIHGFTMAYRYTRDPRMLQTAQKVTDYYLSRLPADGIPFWDFDAPTAQQRKDSSAAAVVASALLELSELVTAAADKARYRDAALKMLETLASPAYLASGTSTYAILNHGVGNYPANQEVDVGLIYGDYYLLEAVLRFKRLTSSRAISMGATWRYDDRGVDPGAQWTNPAFNDSAWRSGPAQLGYGDGDETTQMTRTSPSQPSVYFRRHVTLAGPVTQAALRVIHDDGVAVWVNGTLVFSKYVANGTAHSVYASATSQDNELSSSSVNPSPFREGDNVIAVMVKQSGGSSSDISFDLELTATTRPSSGPQGPQGIAFGESWRYSDSGVDPGPQWFTLAFNDSGWAMGPGQLGYGDGDEATVLRRLSPAQPSVYFRKKLTLSGPVTSAELQVLHDDGVAVWVNGTLVFSRYVGNGTSHAVYASSTSADNQVSTAIIPGSAFVSGENIIAVMVKQSSPTSSDVSFDLALTPTLQR
ncbi:glycoside hydrolase family 88 protein [Hyalangium versicolor]|uniref:glycoside hydrolase family 88 protein n=1 Tax=Hyalangium versicolor TaxID=2861190 RepID=UPI001CCDA3FB|nr:glycoside hydrolase family 88 protein [Hyalangium versicolor]